MNSEPTFPESPFPVFEPEETRISDPFFSQTVRMYLTRAKLWNRVGHLHLILTVIFVALCIYLFLRGDSRQKLLSESEVELTVRLTDEKMKLREYGKREANELANSIQLDRANVIASRLGQLIATLENYQQKKTEGQSEKVRTFIALARAVLDKMDNLPPAAGPQKTSDLIIDVSAWDPKDSNRFPAESITILSESFSQTTISSEALRKELQDVEAVLKAVEASKFASDSVTTELVEGLIRGVPNIRKLKVVADTINTRSSTASQMLSQSQEMAPYREKERQATEQSIEQIEKDLSEIRTERDKILFMAWLPDLTVRVGAVVLLLFLTQIFIATYRYTIALSAFYLARADVIRLLQPESDTSARFRTEDFQVLSDKLSPTLGVDDIKSPTEHATDLVKAWISKFPGKT